MAGYLLDTNVLIDFTLGRSPILLERMGAAAPGTLTMSAITYAELAVGARTSSDPVADARRLQGLSRQVAVQPFDLVAATIYGRLVRQVGPRRSSFDRLIAAHALALGSVLVTSNERDFADVPDLAIENWSVPEDAA